MTPLEVRSVNVTAIIPALGCTLHFTGTEGGTWDNIPQALSLPGTTPTLAVTASGFCPGAASTGALIATYNVSATAPIVLS